MDHKRETSQRLADPVRQHVVSKLIVDFRLMLAAVLFIIESNTAYDKAVFELLSKLLSLESELLEGF